MQAQLSTDYRWLAADRVCPFLYNTTQNNKTLSKKMPKALQPVDSQLWLRGHWFNPHPLHCQ